MAEWVCSKCGYVRDSRCKPKKCPECDAGESFDKKDEVKPAAKKTAAKKSPAKKVK